MYTLRYIFDSPILLLFYIDGRTRSHTTTIQSIFDINLTILFITFTTTNSKYTKLLASQNQSSPKCCSRFSTYPSHLQDNIHHNP